MVEEEEVKRETEKERPTERADRKRVVWKQARVVL